MEPAIVAAIAAGALVLGIGIGMALTRGRHQRELERLAGDQQNTVGLYLRRKVAEEGIDPGRIHIQPGAQEALDSNRALAQALLDKERRAMEMGDTQELGLARTMRLESTDELDAAVEQSKEHTVKE
jgi:hypothetical protein